MYQDTNSSELHMHHTFAADMVREPGSAYQTASIQNYTLEDYLALPDNVRAELIDGELIFMGQVLCYFFEANNAPSIYSFETPVPVHIFQCEAAVDFSEIEAGIFYE